MLVGVVEGRVQLRGGPEEARSLRVPSGAVVHHADVRVSVVVPRLQRQHRACLGVGAGGWGWGGGWGQGWGCGQGLRLGVAVRGWGWAKARARARVEAHCRQPSPRPAAPGALARWRARSAQWPGAPLSPHGWHVSSQYKEIPPTPTPPPLASSSLHPSLHLSHLSACTYHLPLTTYHIPPTTCHLPPATYHSPGGCVACREIEGGGERSQRRVGPPEL